MAVKKNLTVTRQFKGDGDSATLTDAISLSADVEVEIPGIDVTGANQDVAIAFLLAGLQWLRIESNVACTVYWNDLSSGTPDGSTAVPLMSTNGAYLWTAKEPAIAAPTADVTIAYVTVPAGTATLKFRAGYNNP